MPFIDVTFADGRNDGASAEPGEPIHYGFSPAVNSVWFNWTAPKSGSLTLEAASSFAPVLAGYTGDGPTGDGVHLLVPLSKKVVRIAPPLVITTDEAAAAMGILERAARRMLGSGSPAPVLVG